MFMKKYIVLFLFFLSGCTVDPSGEINRTLDMMNQAYENKDLDAFMYFISPDYLGKKDILQIGVENDFAGFTEIDYQTSVSHTDIDPQSGIYQADVSYSRSLKSPRHGVDNQEGKAFLTFIKKDGELKLVDMSDPTLYGIIAP